MLKSLCTRKLTQTTYFSFLVVFSILIHSDTIFAATEPAPIELEQKSTWETFREKLRVRTFTEYMSPAFQGNGINVPTPDGTALNPNFTFNIVWTDYDIGNDWKILYFQRFLVFFDSPVGFAIRNPRFAIRKVNVFNVPNLTTTYDLYIQPGLAAEATNDNDRKFEFGFRTNTAYAIPKSKWTVGAISELTFSPSYGSGKPGSDFYGWVTATGSYEFSPVVSTVHYATINFKHGRNQGFNGLAWDAPLPYIQNGVSLNVSKQMWMSFFLNNQLTALPKWSNMWASMWLGFTIL